MNNDRILLWHYMDLANSILTEGNDFGLFSKN